MTTLAKCESFSLPEEVSAGWGVHKYREFATILDADWPEWRELSHYGLRGSADGPCWRCGDRLSPADATRLAELLTVAARRNRAYRERSQRPVVDTPENDLFAYAEEVGKKMRARSAAVSE